jgi:hypothetical protein
MVDCLTSCAGYDSAARQITAVRRLLIDVSGASEGPERGARSIVMPVSGVSLPVTRPVGRALVVGNDACRADMLRALQPQGYECVEAADPYVAMIELSRQRLAFQTLILCLGSMFREELIFISTVKRRMPHIEIWLTQTEGRMAALAEGMRLGADGLVAEDGSLHRMAAPHLDTATTLAEPVTPLTTEPEPQATSYGADSVSDETPIGEPVLTADELRALLQDQPSMPPSGNVE